MDRLLSSQALLAGRVKSCLITETLTPSAQFLLVHVLTAFLKQERKVLLVLTQDSLVSFVRMAKKIGRLDLQKYASSGKLVVLDFFSDGYSSYLQNDPSLPTVTPLSPHYHFGRYPCNTSTDGDLSFARSFFHTIATHVSEREVDCCLWDSWNSLLQLPSALTQMEGWCGLFYQFYRHLQHLSPEMVLVSVWFLSSDAPPPHTRLLRSLQHGSQQVLAVAPIVGGSNTVMSTNSDIVEGEIVSISGDYHLFTYNLASGQVVLEG